MAAYPNILYTSTIQRETIYRAWNRGIAIARGKYITNANTDDVLRNDALEVLASALDANPAVAMVYADQYISHIPNQLFADVHDRHRLCRPPFSRIALLQGSLAGSQPMWRASLHSADKLWFNEQLEVAGDYEFTCAVAQKYTLLKVEDVLGVYYKAKDLSNKEFSNVFQTVSEVFTIQEKYGRCYVASLTAAERDSLFVACSWLMRIPRVFFFIGREVVAKLFPTVHISSRMFWCWLASLIKESEGDIESAKKCCVSVYRTGSENLVQRQYARLAAISTA